MAPSRLIHTESEPESCEWFSYIAGPSLSLDPVEARAEDKSIVRRRWRAGARLLVIDSTMTRTLPPYLIALTLTLALEWPFVWLGLRRLEGRYGTLRLLAVFLVTHLFTHGSLWHFWSLLPGAYLARVLLGESLVWLVEATLYRMLWRASWAKTLTVSALANLFSTVVGLLIWQAWL